MKKTLLEVTFLAIFFMFFGLYYTTREPNVEYKPIEYIANEYDSSLITKEEFNKIQIGMSKTQVEYVIGGPGEILSEISGGSMYMRKGIKLGSNANIMIIDGEVYSKAQFGL